MTDDVMTDGEDIKSDNYKIYVLERRFPARLESFLHENFPAEYVGDADYEALLKLLLKAGETMMERIQKRQKRAERKAEREF